MGCAATSATNYDEHSPSHSNPNNDTWDNAPPPYQEEGSSIQDAYSSKKLTTNNPLSNALSASALGRLLPINLAQLICEYLEIHHIFLCSHNGTDIVAFDFRGRLIGTIAKAPNSKRQWVTGFDFDSKGNLYIAIYVGFMAKYNPISQSSDHHSKAKYDMTHVMDDSFTKKMTAIMAKFQSDNSLYPEGLRIIENDHYSSIFVTSMDPVHGVLQLSLDGDLQRVICRDGFRGAWSMKVVPSHFLKSLPASSPLAKLNTVLAVAAREKLYFIDVDAGEMVKRIEFGHCRANKHIGDFTFIEPQEGGQSIMVMNLQEGLLQFQSSLGLLQFQSSLDLDCRRFDVNQHLSIFTDLESKPIKNSYGTCIGPQGDLYFADHDAHRIIRINFVEDVDLLSGLVCVNVDEVEEVFRFTKQSHSKKEHCPMKPNYAQWYDARLIGVHLPVNVLFGI